MKINDELRLKAGFYAGLRGLVKENIKDRIYLLGVRRGDAYYHNHWLVTKEECQVPEINPREPELVFSGLMQHVGATVTVLRRKMGTSPRFTEHDLEQMAFFSSFAAQVT